LEHIVFIHKVAYVIFDRILWRAYGQAIRYYSSPLLRESIYCHLELAERFKFILVWLAAVGYPLLSFALPVSEVNVLPGYYPGLEVGLTPSGR
jgi:hypothetical protein